MTFARRVFTVAWVYGFLALLPMYFMENWYMERVPPALTHPEFYYGFIGVAVAWQALFLMIAREPARMRPAMLPAGLEKLAWGIAVPVLVLQGRSSIFFLPSASIDLILAVLFVMAWQKTAEPR
jgi:hypothetical protein